LRAGWRSSRLTVAEAAVGRGLTALALFVPPEFPRRLLLGSS
jgi:hypothetical protein